MEPENPTFKNPRAPTIEERDAEYVPVKHNFSERFERPAFEGTIDTIEKIKRVPCKVWIYC